MKPLEQRVNPQVAMAQAHGSIPAAAPSQQAGLGVKVTVSGTSRFGSTDLGSPQGLKQLEDALAGKNFLEGCVF